MFKLYIYSVREEKNSFIFIYISKAKCFNFIFQIVVVIRINDCLKAHFCRKILVNTAMILYFESRIKKKQHLIERLKVFSDINS